MPILSKHISSRCPSAIRASSIRFAERTDGVKGINVAIGNVPLPMHPAMIERMNHLGGFGSPFSRGKVMYTSTVGESETREAFLNVLQASGFPTYNLYAQVTDGGSQAMELVLLAMCGPAGSSESPLLMIDASYTNYRSFAERLGRRIVSFQRWMDDDGSFAFPSISEIEDDIKKYRPAGLLVIPYDNPTGQLYSHQQLVDLANLCVQYDMWLISDEAYRELFYQEGARAVSIWGLTEAEVPGITGRRVGIETASKVWNACGLRIGALVTDNAELHTRCVAENTVSLCSNAIGQYIFGALAKLSHSELQEWFSKQRAYYSPMIKRFASSIKAICPEMIVSKPSAAIYSVVDLRHLVDGRFDPMDFVMWCAGAGSAVYDGELYTVLTAPMPEFYAPMPGVKSQGRTQLRVAFVAAPEVMERVPGLLVALFKQYWSRFC